MQTSLKRRQRHRRDGRRPSGGGSVRTVAIALPLFLLGTLILVGLVGLASVVAAYNHYSEGLPDPKKLLGEITFAQQTRVYDRTGAVELARFGDFKREVVEYADIPRELIDATTAIEDKTFWENAGFDPVGIFSAGLDTLRGRERGASTITQQLVRTRLLPASAFEEGTYVRKIKEIIQSVRLTQAFPGDDGKQRIMAAYLNQNFYGNQSWGVKAAAKAYFGKELDDLTLAQTAILAGLPQAPDTFDLVKNAEVVCDVEVAEGSACPVDKSRLVVPTDAEIVQRRDYILELMKTRSVLSGSAHRIAEYDAAKLEPVELIPQKTQNWKAPQFVVQVQRELGAIFCPESPANCETVATGGLQVVTSLDWGMQQTVEKWLYAAARAPQAKDTKDTNAVLNSLKIPKSDWGWIANLRGSNIHNAAGAVADARTGQVLAYAGSAGHYETGSERFQPQFDVLSLGYRQPGSAIKPIDYAIGIDDKTMTAATMFMDVVTDFGGKFIPNQADNRERGPVRLRSALQFSLNIPAIKAGLINGLEHQLERSRDFGLTYLKGAIPVTSMSIGTLETRPIDMIQAYGTIANGGVRMPRRMILEVRDASGSRVWPSEGSEIKGEQVISPQAAYIVTDILAGNTVNAVNPYWADWAVYDGKTRREAAYKTGTTSDNKDVAAYGYLAPSSDPKRPQLVVGVWMGNSDSSVNKGSLSLDSSAPLWSNILAEVSQGLPFAQFADSRPKGISEARVDAFSGLLPGPFTGKVVTELFIDGTVPRNVDDTKVALEIDPLTGDLWAEGCAGPPETRGFLDLSRVEERFPAWQKANIGWALRAAKGSGTGGGLEGAVVTYFYNGAFAPFGRTWGGPFAPTETCTPPPSPPPCDPLFSPDPNWSPDPLNPTPLPCPSPDPSPEPSASPKPKPSPTATPKPTPKPSKSPKPSPAPSG